jgi:hypothetical protein
MNDDFSEPSDDRFGADVFDGRDGNRWFRWFLIWGVPALALLLAEQAAAAIVLSLIACLRFGWTDWLTAIWVLSRDPDRSRGRLLALTGLAVGLLRVSFGALVLGFTLVAVDAWMRMAVRVPNQALATPFLSFAIAYGAGDLLLFVVAIVAWWLGHTMVWGEGLRQSFREGQWPPNQPIRCRLATTFFVMAFPKAVAAFLMIGLPIMTLLLGQGRGPPPNGMLAGVAQALLVLFIVIAAFSVLVCGAIGQRVFPLTGNPWLEPDHA